MRPLPFLAGLSIGLLGVLAADTLRSSRIKAAKDWLDPANAPPAFSDVLVHLYDPHKVLHCCQQCGGGLLHPIHNVRRFSLGATLPSVVTQSELVADSDTAALLRETPGSWLGEKGNEF